MSTLNDWTGSRNQPDYSCLDGTRTIHSNSMGSLEVSFVINNFDVGKTRVPLANY